MPWQELKPMDQKIQMIGEWKCGLYSKTDLSNKYGITRKTVHKWIDRYEKVGIDGLKELSRAPLNSPKKIEQEQIGLIISEKLKNKKRGPKKIFTQLNKSCPDIKIPSISTIGNYLKKAGLVQNRKRRYYVSPYNLPFQTCTSANEVWSVDYKGQFHTKNGKACYPLTLTDNYSRYLLRCEGLIGPRFKETKDVLISAFIEYGMPVAIRSDNGTPFAGRGICGLSRLSLWFIKLGIVPERIKKGCPQQNGRHERMHRTLKAEAITGNIKRDLSEQQVEFEIFRNDYNNYRPHEALNQETPSSHYKKSNRPYIEKPLSPEYDIGYLIRKVRHNGEIRFNGKMYYLTCLLKKQPVALKEVSDGIWQIYYSFYELAKLDLRKDKIIR